MNRIAISLVLLSLSAYVYSQPKTILGFTDAQRMNLKGSVVHVIEEECSFHEAFGEVILDGKKTYRVSIFNKGGNFLFDTADSDLDRVNNSNPNCGFMFYSYNSDGRVLEIEKAYMKEDVKRNYNEYSVALANWTSANHLPYKDIYEYDAGGRIKSITEYHDEQIVQKDIFKYNEH